MFRRPFYSLVVAKCLNRSEQEAELSHVVVINTRSQFFEGSLDVVWQINHYHLDYYCQNVLRYPMESDFSNG